jgi:hypothetical protein
MMLFLRRAITCRQQHGVAPRDRGLVAATFVAAGGVHRDPDVHRKATTGGKRGHSISSRASIRRSIRDAATRARRPSHA